jgi:hypothetical protein
LSPDGRLSLPCREHDLIPAKENTVRTLLTIAGVALLIIGAMALGLKFFNTSVREEEDQKGWDE